MNGRMKCWPLIGTGLDNLDGDVKCAFSFKVEAGASFKIENVTNDLKRSCISASKTKVICSQCIISDNNISDLNSRGSIGIFWQGVDYIIQGDGWWFVDICNSQGVRCSIIWSGAYSCIIYLDGYVVR